MGISLQPFIEDSIVNAAEIGGELKVFFGVEVEIGALPEDAALNVASHDKEGGSGTVVGASASIFGSSASEF